MEVWCCKDCGRLEFFSAPDDSDGSLPQTTCPNCGPQPRLRLPQVSLLRTFLLTEVLHDTHRAAWAKINLTLDILGKRPDGYHEMKMVMQSIDLCDNLELSERGSAGDRRLLHSALPTPGRRQHRRQGGGRSFSPTLGRPAPGLDIHIRKQIPVCAGMAGGQQRRRRRPPPPPAALRPLHARGGAGGCRRPGGQRRALLRPGRHGPGAGPGGDPHRFAAPCRRAISPCASPPSPSPPRSSSPRCGPAACTVTRTPPA